MKEGTDIDAFKRKLEKHLGERFRVFDRYEQQADTFRIMKIEKFISYLFLTFILMIPASMSSVPCPCSLLISVTMW